jgi:transitional endoplasmic reticulum ATPase
MGMGNSNVGLQVVNQILVEMDGIEDRQGVIVVASTNRPDLLDPALLRPGRFDRLIYVPAPDWEGRLKILTVHTKNMPLSPELTQKIPGIAQATDGYSGADLENVCREAGMQAIREKLEGFEKIELSHFEFALKRIQASISPDIIAKYNEISEQLSKKRYRTAGTTKEPGLFS